MVDVVSGVVNVWDDGCWYLRWWCSLFWRRLLLLLEAGRRWITSFWMVEGNQYNLDGSGVWLNARYLGLIAFI